MLFSGHPSTLKAAAMIQGSVIVVREAYPRRRRLATGIPAVKWRRWARHCEGRSSAAASRRPNRSSVIFDGDRAEA